MIQHIVFFFVRENFFMEKLEDSCSLIAIMIPFGVFFNNVLLFVIKLGQSYFVAVSMLFISDFISRQSELLTLIDTYFLQT